MIFQGNGSELSSFSLQLVPLVPRAHADIKGSQKQELTESQISRMANYPTRFPHPDEHAF